MAIKVLIKRKIPEGFNDPQFDNLIRKLRTLAVIRPDYISGETLKRIDQPHEFLVISTWQNIDAWNAWQASRERKKIQEQIDAMLGSKTEYGFYDYL
jgi:heme oxygenase (mycobilin-producing)